MRILEIIISLSQRTRLSFCLFVCLSLDLDVDPSFLSWVQSQTHHQLLHHPQQDSTLQNRCDNHWLLALWLLQTPWPLSHASCLHVSRRWKGALAQRERILPSTLSCRFEAQMNSVWCVGISKWTFSCDGAHQLSQFWEEWKCRQR